MRKRIPFITVLALGITAIICLAAAPQALAMINLLDGDLRIDGFFKEYMFIRTHIPGDEQRFHNTNLDQALSSFLIEGLYKVKEDQCQTLNLFAGIRYWYEKASVWDSKLNSAIPSHEKARYQHPVNEKDIITEAYADYIRGPFNIRIGKQIVVWGETDIKRTVDIVNPLDMRYGQPGVFSWAELKQGLWMMRGFYQSQLPGTLLFEGIYNPGYYQSIRLPIEGSHWGPNPAKTSFNPGHGYGIYNWSVTKKWKEDAPPKWAADNWELGFRVRGFTWNIDWTLLYYNSRSDGPVANEHRIGAYALNYVVPGIISTITDGPIHPKPYDKKVYSYQRYQLFGGTMQTAIDKLHGSVWRLEWFYEYGQHYNKGTAASTSNIYDTVKRDTVGLGLNYSDKFDIPYLTRYWFNNQYFQVSLTAFYEKVFNYSADLIIDASRDHGFGASHGTTFSWNLMQFWDSNVWAFVCTGSWSPIGKGFQSVVLAYAPGQHWRFEGGPVIYWSGCGTNQGYADKDSILVRIRYEF